MKKLLALTIFFNLLISVLPFATSISQAQVNPWPWSVVLPFPWDKISGTWTERTTEYTFTFQVVENSWGTRHIKIKQTKANSGVTLEGIGYENSDSIVVAAMSGGEEEEYLITIRSIQSIFCWDQHIVTGVTIESPDHQLLRHFEIFKIKELPLTPLSDKDYKNALPEPYPTKPGCWTDDTYR